MVVVDVAGWDLSEGVHKRFGWTGICIVPSSWNFGSRQGVTPGTVTLAIEGHAHGYVFTVW